jgi:hypothetical protein
MKLSKRFATAVSVMTTVAIVGCAAGPQLVVDPSSISDQKKYMADRKECVELSKNYSAASAKAGGAAVGAAAGLGTAALIAATGGLFFLPAGIAVAAGGGAALGSKSAKNTQSRAREKIQAECMNDRGYKAYTP